MKRFVILWILFFVGCASEPIRHLPIIENQNQAGDVFVIREKKFYGSKGIFYIKLDGINIFEIKNGENTMFKVASGEHSISAKQPGFGGKEKFVRFTILPQQKVFFMVSAKLFSFDIQQISPDLGKMYYKTHFIEILKEEEINMVILEDIVNSLAAIGKPCVKELTSLLKDTDRKTASFAAIVLGRIGREAKNAIPVIIESFPDVTLETDFPGLEGGGLASVGEIENSKNILESDLSLKYGKFFIINYEKDWLGIFKKPKYTINAGAYSLNKITGEDFGNDKNKWLQWWEKNKSNYE